jgi:hypothetical protein
LLHICLHPETLEMQTSSIYSMRWLVFGHCVNELALWLFFSTFCRKEV